jgi:hypothetical protein
MSKWRPEGWKNPCRSPQVFAAFEDGADAMLEILKGKGAWMTPEQMRVLAPERKYPYGHLVFIPEEEIANQQIKENVS